MVLYNPICVYNMTRESYMKVEALPVLDDNYAYVVHHGSKCVVIDPSECSIVHEYIIRNHLEVVAILLTHKHWDHVGGVSELSELHHCPVYGGEFEQFDVEVQKLSHQKKLNLGDFVIEPIHLPGHTAGAMGYLISDILFTGDVLFGAGSGHVFEGTMQDMLESLDKIRALPDHVEIYFGHEYTRSNLNFAIYLEPENIDIEERLANLSEITTPSTLQLERLTNPFLRIDEPSVRKAIKAYVGQEMNDRAERLKAVRELKNEFGRG